MSSQILVVGRVLGAILLVALALFCGYGFLASYELGFPNVFHAVYGTVGVTAVMGAIWLAVPACNSRGTAAAAKHMSNPSVAFPIAVVLLVGLIGGVGGGIFGLVVGAVHCGNHAPDFVFAGGRGYEAGASLGLLLGFVSGSFGSGVVAALSLRRIRAR